MNKAAAAIGCKARGARLAGERRVAAAAAPGGVGQSPAAGAAPTGGGEGGLRGREAPGAKVFLVHCHRETLRPGFAQPAVSPECPNLATVLPPDIPPGARTVRAHGACRGHPARPSPPCPEHQAGSCSSERTARGCAPRPRIPQHPAGLETQTHRRRKTCFIRDPRGLQLLLAEIPRALCLSPLATAPSPASSHD